MIRNGKGAMLGWSILTFIVVSIAGTFSTGLPAIVAQNRLLPEQSSWLVTEYSIAIALASAVYTRLANSCFMAKLLGAGLFICGAASIAGLFGSSYSALAAIRLLQAIGAASVPGLSFVYVMRYIPAESRSVAFLQIACSVGLAFGLGPLLGGGMTEFWGWHSLFVLPSLLLLPSLVLLPAWASRKEDAEPDKRSRFHWLDILRWGCSLLKLLRLPLYMWRLALQFVVFFVQMSVLYLLSMKCADLSYSAIETGALLTPGALCSALLIWRLGGWIRRRGRDVLAFSFVMAAAGSLLIAWGSSIPRMSIIVGYAAIAAGTTMANAGLNHQVSTKLNGSDPADGLALAQLSQFLGGASGVALSGQALGFYAPNNAGAVYDGLFLSMSGIAALSALYYCVMKKRESRRFCAKSIG
ncbi:MFS transporter [Paenibacillus sp. NEAU-GSW1]|uniref:MFS transporter n=1 Tax=Paenibacillus sp. NEAU-GSW1 TaxID=2682486 RepID=UPI001564E120|nr:MFS transporter [Paenibacillus sp. NEAU-GSW1]